jgi:hypothetical protein
MLSGEGVLVGLGMINKGGVVQCRCLRKVRALNFGDPIFFVRLPAVPCFPSFSLVHISFVRLYSFVYSFPNVLRTFLYPLKHYHILRDPPIIPLALARTITSCFSALGNVRLIVTSLKRDEHVRRENDLRWPGTRGFRAVVENGNVMW